jgi:uncharacterized protein (DUF697 family)/ribosome biogenesis GTPase A
MSKFPWLRSLVLLVVLGSVAGVLLAIVERLIWIYSAIASSSPLLAALVVLLLVALLLGLFWVIWHYFNLFQRRPKKKRTQPEVSSNKVEAAAESLQALQQQVQQIQDEVTRRSLQERSEELRQNFARRELQVVIFGVGSAGKTSLVNALIGDRLGDRIGEVGAPMGTTKVGEVYGPIKIEGLKFPIAITDSPGILEAGVAGTKREGLARKLATEADLLLFVVDDDLRASEYEPLKALAEIGKRSLLVFNKIDRYTKSDRAILHERLRERVREFIAPEDVVAIAARPAPLTLESGETLVSPPRLKALLSRMVAVLRREGDELAADNILMQSQRLTEETRTAINAQRQVQAEQVIERFQWLVVGVIFATPLPVVDLLATAAVNAQMVVEIGKIYGCDINFERGKELVSSLTTTLASLGIVKGVVQIVSAAISITVVGYLLKATVQAVAGAYLTHIAGKSFIEYFSRDQDWGDGGITEVVQRQFQLNRRDEFMKSFVKEAVSRVMQISKTNEKS